MKKIVALLSFLFIPLSFANLYTDYNEEIVKNINETLMFNYIKNLQDFGPRVTGSNACWQAGNYIYNELKSNGLKTHFINWSYGGYEDRNVEAILEGEREDSIIICAHYDTVAQSPGADDDASGVAAVLAAAKAISKYKDEIRFTYTIRFVTFSGEEEGLLGSYSYAIDAYENGMKIVAVLNADMIGFTRSEIGKENVWIFEKDSSKWITNVSIEMANRYENYVGLQIHRRDATANSDHWSFISCGYDAVFFHEYEFNNYYHTNKDTVEHMDLEYCARVARLITLTLLEIAKMEIIDKEKPQIEIKKPKDGYLYINDREIMKIKETVIIGKINFVIEAKDKESGINRVELYFDGKLIAELKTYPYKYLFDEFALFKHEIEAIAFDNWGNKDSQKIEAIIFNLNLSCS